MHSQGYLRGQETQARHWFGARAGELAWCTAASGWSKSARNAFVAPWTAGAAALLHDARFDPAERLPWRPSRGSRCCASPHGVPDDRQAGITARPRPPSLRRLVSAGEPLNPEVIEVFREALGLDIHDGYGQTETGQLTGMPEGFRFGRVRWEAPPGVLTGRDRRRRPPGGGGRADARPGDRPDVLPRLPRRRAVRGPVWRTGDRVRRDADGFLWFEGRLDDVILSAGYRIGPFEVESALVEHPAVAEAAAVAVPDAERGAVVKAVVVLRPGHVGDPALAQALQEHVKRATAPYKHPRVVEFVAELPKTASGKIRRAELREPA